MYDNAILIRSARALMVPVLVTLGATAVHHVYGGIRYATPWRTHGAAVALLVAALLTGLYFRVRRAPGDRLGRAAGWLLALLSLLFPVLLIGVFEGVYNHLAKNISYFGGMSRALLLELFPPPTYELPNDVVFELTGVLQVAPAALALRGLLAFVRALPRGSEAPPPGSRRLSTGARIEPRQLATLSGESLRVPDATRLVHLQFRRFAGCPVCHLHLRSFVKRERELRAAGVLEVIVFHSTALELQKHAGGLPLCVVADPGKRLYREFGVESGRRALLDARAWLPILRAVGHALAAILRGRARAPSIDPAGGRWGLPADFLIASNGRVLGCKYGEHADDHWSVDELLTHAKTLQAPVADAAPA